MLGLAALLLGSIGFTKNGIATGEVRTLLDNLYLTLGLLSMNSGSVPGPVSWELQVARFLVPALAAYTALLALAMVFTQQSQQVRLWFMRDHVIICGLGRKGARLAKKFRDRGEKVVVIEADEGNDWIETSRSSGVVVLNGNASDPETLRKARLNRARYLISVVGDDGKNAEDTLSTRNSGIFYERRNWTSLQIRISAWNCSISSTAAPAYCSRHTLPGQVTRVNISVISILCLSVWENWASPWSSRLQMDVRSADFQSAEFLYDEGGNCDVDSVYVCMDNDSLGLRTGLTLYQKIRDHQTPVIVRMAEDAGLALLLKDNDKSKNTYKNLHAFPLLDQTCTPDLILRGTHEVLARDLHESYLEGPDSEKVTDGGDPARDLWEDLPEDIKEKNRRQADRIGVILDEHSYRIAPLTNWNAADLVFREEKGAEEVESMARMEHELWCQEMTVKYWKYGPKKDEELKTNPDLVPWEDLPQAEKEKNFRFVRDLPRLLTRAGFQIKRRPPTVKESME
jgi:voltage-gated potassium channel Kch